MMGPSKKTLNKRDAATLAQYQQDKGIRESTAKDAYRSEQQMESMFNDLSTKDRGPGSLGSKRSGAERNKFLFIDDEEDEDTKRQNKEDEDDEDRIDDGLDNLMVMTGKLKGAAMGMGANLTTQNERLDRLGGKVSPLTNDNDHLGTSLTGYHRSMQWTIV